MWGVRWKVEGSRPRVKWLVKVRVFSKLPANEALDDSAGDIFQL